jgi:hypothetical protein
MRNKLRLDLDALAVESFDTRPALAPRGTIVAHDSATEPQDPQTIVNTCDCPTAAWTCGCTVPGSGQTYCGAYTCAGDSCYYTNCLDTCDNCPQEPATPFSPC